ncbi:hypothetical protein [Methanocaldococcus sp.]
MNGNPERGFYPAPENIRKQLLIVKQKWEPYYKAVKTVATADKNSPEFKEALKYIEEHNLEILKEMHKAVLMYEDLYNQKIAFIETISLFALILSIVIIILGLFIIN